MSSKVGWRPWKLGRWSFSREISLVIHTQNKSRSLIFLLFGCPLPHTLGWVRRSYYNILCEGYLRSFLAKRCRFFRWISSVLNKSVTCASLWKPSWLIFFHCYPTLLSPCSFIPSWLLLWYFLWYQLNTW